MGDERIANLRRARLSACRRNVESRKRSHEFFLLNPELFAPHRKGWKPYLDLDGRDKNCFSLILRNIFNQVQGGYSRHLSTEDDPGALTGLERTVDEILLGRGVREFLGTVAPGWKPEFREFVETCRALLDQ